MRWNVQAHRYAVRSMTARRAQRDECRVSRPLVGILLARGRHRFRARSTQVRSEPFRASPSRCAIRSKRPPAAKLSALRARLLAGAAFALVVVVMNNRLAAVTELVFLLDHRLPILAGLTLPDDRGAVAVTIAISMGFTRGDACAHRAHANANFFG